jgi:hypothetical protein
MNWKQFNQVSEIPVTWDFIWTLIKKRFKKEPYHMTISFHYQESGDVKLTGAQLEFGNTTG